jgi:hypothetical protein
MSTIRCSEAILLGDTLLPRNAGVWLAPDGSCGCALGRAVLAVGAITPDEIKAAPTMDCWAWRALVLERIQGEWPFLMDRNEQGFRVLDRISTEFSSVCSGATSLEALMTLVDHFDTTLHEVPETLEESVSELAEK